ncbi:MAG: uracil-DNA glycosylase [Deltaproteobacteria bacterium]|nr:uracil-DNA glycosylase [Deltaproteobacteria bacterium]
MPLSFNSIIEETKESLSFLKEIGCNDFECSEKSLKIIEQWKFKKLKSEVISCNKCGLDKSRNNIVFGDGALDAKLLFIGSAPGAEEEKSGKPLSGDAGTLLNKIISAMGLSLKTVYICNILKCKTEKNIKDCEEEIKKCLPFLKEQIKKINPDVICTLGTYASKTLLNSKAGITALRGKFHNYNGIKVMPTFHPAELIENKNKKSYVWEDMKKIMTEIL